MPGRAEQRSAPGQRGHARLTILMLLLHPSFPDPAGTLPVRSYKIPCSSLQGIRARSAQAAGKIWPRAGRERLDSNKFPVIFPVSRETTPRDWFAADCFLRQSVWSQHSLWACTRIQKPNSRGPLRENLCTPTHRRRPRILSLGRLVSEAPHFADLVRILRNANFVPLSDVQLSHFSKVRAASEYKPLPTLRSLHR